MKADVSEIIKKTIAQLNTAVYDAQYYIGEKNGVSLYISAKGRCFGIPDKRYASKD